MERLSASKLGVKRAMIEKCDLEGCVVAGRGDGRRSLALLAAAVACIGLLTGCAQLTSGRAVVGHAALPVKGDSGGRFDTEVKDALADVIAFWTKTYPTIAHGRRLPKLRGKLYSIDGDAVVHTHKAPGYAGGNACLKERLSFIIDNAAYCRLDDSIVWDRGSDHLLPVLVRRYGPALLALVFAHEFGHAIQSRLHLQDVASSTIDLESQADCAAGAFTAYALAGHAPHFPLTKAELDRALEGYFQVRDSTPASAADISHGNGFDRLNALQNGIAKGASYCFGKNYYKNLTYTERGFVTDQDYLQGGNQPMAEELGKHGIAPDLNRFWTAAGQTVHKTFQPVRLQEADHPACGTAIPTSEFSYCPDDNVVYYSADFAKNAYNSITTIHVDPDTAEVTIEPNQPGDFALGELISIAWGMAARHQFFGGSTDDRAGLMAAICYSGAYAHDINRAHGNKTHTFLLSPPDMDEATLAELQLVPMDSAFGARDTTGLQRVQEFVKGYARGLSAC
jgi:predicted metalloprotease